MLLLPMMMTWWDGGGEMLLGWNVAVMGVETLIVVTTNSSLLASVAAKSLSAAFGFVTERQSIGADISGSLTLRAGPVVCR